MSQSHGLAQARVGGVGVALEVGQERIDIGRQPRELVPEAREVGVGLGEGVDVLGLGDQVRCQVADDALDIGLDVLCAREWDLFSTVCPPESGSFVSAVCRGQYTDRVGVRRQLSGVDYGDVQHALATLHLLPELEDLGAAEPPQA